MLDINLIRKNPKVIKDSQKKRGKNIKIVDEVLKLDKKWRGILKLSQELKHKRNMLSEDVNKLKKQNKTFKHKIQEIQNIVSQIKKADQTSIDLLNKRNKLLLEIGNILHSSVPIGKNELQNKIIKKVGQIKKFTFKPKNHIELIENLKIGDFTQSANVSSSKFYYLKDKLALLNQALIQFAIDFMKKKNYTYVETPLMLRKKAIQTAMDFEEFENQIYKIENEDLYLIGTAEHSLLAFHMNQILKEKDLPLKYFSYSMCFRKELGSHGIDEKGLFRTHQFNKIEQFIFCKPKDSYKYYNELLKNSEEIYKKLKIPYRILEMCSGDLALWKSKGCDIEAYFPSQKKYREVGSLSNCTDYQTRKANIKFLRNKEKIYVHTINNTTLATSRALMAILENYQTKEGYIKIPKVLQKYTGFKIIK